MLTNKIEGLIAAPFTAFDPNGELNLDLIPAYYRSLKKNNVKGAFICGSTGAGGKGQGAADQVGRHPRRTGVQAPGRGDQPGDHFRRAQEEV